MKISFQNNSGAVELQLDPLDEDIEVKFSRQYIPEEKKERKVQAPPPAAPATTIVQTPAPTVQVVQAPAAKTAAQDSAQNSLMMDKKKKTQQDEKAAVEDPAKVARLVSSLQKAQQAFYTKDYEKAAEFAQQSLDVQETAEAHALKGSAEYMLKNTTQARSHWKNALSLNPNMEGVKRWLQKTGEGQE
jgi:tetratricopeptide (TPR) repeat protein